MDLEKAIDKLAKSNPKPDLLSLFAEIDRLTEQLPPSTEPALLHYLRQKSYRKARLFLEGQDAKNEIGNCRRTHSNG